MTIDYHEKLSKHTQNRAETYLHIARGMVMNDFGPATEHTHIEATVSLAAAMLQYEGSQLVANAMRSRQDD